MPSRKGFKSSHRMDQIPNSTTKSHSLPFPPFNWCFAFQEAKQFAIPHKCPSPAPPHCPSSYSWPVWPWPQLTTLSSNFLWAFALNRFRNVVAVSYLGSEVVSAEYGKLQAKTLLQDQWSASHGAPGNCLAKEQHLVSCSSF